MCYSSATAPVKNLENGMEIRHQPYRRQGQWVVYWKSAWTGKRHHRGFSSEDSAREFVDAMTEIEEREKKALRRRRKRAACPRLTVEELLSRYLSVALSNPVTVRETRYHAAHLLRLFRDRQAARLTCDDALRFIEAQRARGLRQTTINRRVSILRAALRWGVRMGLLAQDPLAGLRLPKASSRRVPPPTPLELRRIFRVAAPHLQRVIVIGAYCGPRIGPSELFRLRWRDVDLERGVIRMPNAAKGARDAMREIPVRKALVPLLRRWRGEDEAAGVEHVVHWRGRQVRTVHRAWHAALRRADVRQELSPYSLRHAYATYSAANGAPLKSLSALMGHRDATMILKVYQHALEHQGARTVEMMPDVLKLGTGRRSRAAGRTVPPVPHMALRRFPSLSLWARFG